MNYQMIQNYCFGHEDSSILFFPTVSSLQYINHSAKLPNAKLRWSTSSLNKKEWLNESLEEIKARPSGLMIDLVATRDISLGEEVLLDYGIKWENAWHKYVKSWQPHSSSLNYDVTLTLRALNEDETNPIRTDEEQETHPYPRNVQINCFNSDKEDSFRVMTSMRYLKPCNVRARKEIGNGKYLYEVEIKNFDLTNDFVVRNFPRWAISFTRSAYTTDQSLTNTFRHEIGFDEGMFPPQWLDLNSDQDIQLFNYSQGYYLFHLAIICYIKK